MSERILIIGAGPAGLGAAWRLKELGYDNFHVYERNNYLGGLAASFTDEAGFTWDIGGHVMFSHYDYYDRVFEELMGGEFQLNERESWVRACGTWVPYPFQNNIRYLPPRQRLECLIGLVRLQSGKLDGEPGNFLQFMRRIFGEGICRHFMEPYNFKVWAHPPKAMSCNWIDERVSVIDVERALANVVLEREDFGWGPNNRFKFPLSGGTGEFYRRFGPPLRKHISLGREVRSINLRERTIDLGDGVSDRFDRLISTMPADVLCKRIVDPLPEKITRAASLLKHSSGHIVGVGIRQPCPSTRSWLYFAEDNCPFYRVTYLSNYSPHMTPDNAHHYSLLCETSGSEHKPVDGESIVEQTIQGLINVGLLDPKDRDDIVSTWRYEVDYSYPVPTVRRDEALGALAPFLESAGIYSRGRFGLWKYEVSNTDHTLMQGVELVNRLLLGEGEKTIGMDNVIAHSSSVHRPWKAMTSLAGEG